MTPTRNPPRYVPTLTEVVRATAAHAAAGGKEATEEQVVRRVMQRIDLTLERRLREAIAATVIEQTRTLAPLLHEQIEAVVRDAVSQAFAEELEARRRAPR